MRIQETSHNTSFCYGLIVTNIETETNRCRFFNKKISAIHQVNQYSVGRDEEAVISNGFLSIRWLVLFFLLNNWACRPLVRHLSLSVYLL